MEKDFFINENGVLNFQCVHGEKDLHPEAFIKNVRFIINPPPIDGHCMCCGRHLRQMQPFREVGHSYDGALLIKGFRNEGPYIKEVDDNLLEALKRAPQNPLVWLISKYGDEEAHKIYSTPSHSWIVKSWECDDCLYLNDEEYFKRRVYMPYKNENIIKNCHFIGSNEAIIYDGTIINQEGSIKYIDIRHTRPIEQL